MVLQHFKLREQPFGVTPDPRFLFASATHREALSALLYGIESGLGFVTLTARPGMGKTTLLFETLRRLGDTSRTIFLFQTIVTQDELFRALLIDLGEKDIPPSLVEMQARLNQVMMTHAAIGNRLILAVDEAQNLDTSVLEALRMLSNFETASRKLMQIILTGQLQLEDKLALPELLQLRQRISIFAYLTPLSQIDTRAYIQHRLRVAGYHGDELIFNSPALNMIAEHSEGIPRNINSICFNALSLGYALKQTTINADVIREVMADLNFESHRDSDQQRDAWTGSDRKDNRSPRAATESIGISPRPLLKMISLAFAVLITLLLFVWLAIQAYRAATFGGSVYTNTRFCKAVSWFCATSIVGSPGVGIAAMRPQEALFLLHEVSWK